MKPKFTAQQQSSYQLSVQSSYQLSVQLWGILQQLAATLRFVISYNNYQLLVIILDFISDVISDNFGRQLYKKTFRVYFQKNIVIMNCNKGLLTIYNSVYNSSSFWLRFKTAHSLKTFLPRPPALFSRRADRRTLRQRKECQKICQHQNQNITKANSLLNSFSFLSHYACLVPYCRHCLSDHMPKTFK